LFVRGSGGGLEDESSILFREGGGGLEMNPASFSGREEGVPFGNVPYSTSKGAWDMARDRVELSMA
jgi:hypothetical protein